MPPIGCRSLRRLRIVILVAAVAALFSAAIKPTFAVPDRPSAPITVYLGFDDGPAPGLTDSILDTLKKYNVKATFFVVGAHIPGNELLLQREIREGHHLGNHLFLHELDIYATNNPRKDVLLRSYALTEAAVNRALGPKLSAVYNTEEPIKPFRWPGGAIKAFPLPVITYNWQVAIGDDTPTGITPPQAIHNILYGNPLNHEYGVFAYGDGVVVLLHDVSRTTAAALPLILKNLLADGVRFGTLPRPGDRPGTLPIAIGVIPRCARQTGNCGWTFAKYPLKYALPASS